MTISPKVFQQRLASIRHEIGQAVENMEDALDAEDYEAVQFWGKELKRLGRKEYRYINKHVIHTPTQ